MYWIYRQQPGNLATLYPGKHGGFKRTLRKMSISDWKKRLYDSKVEIPKTTKWRRSCENINNGVSDDICLGDVWEDLSSDTIELGNNTSPLKRQRLLTGCLSNLRTNTSSSIIKLCETKNLMGTFAWKLKMQKSWNCVYSIVRLFLYMHFLCRFAQLFGHSTDCYIGTIIYNYHTIFCLLILDDSENSLQETNENIGCAFSFFIALRKRANSICDMEIING